MRNMDGGDESSVNDEVPSLFVAPGSRQGSTVRTLYRGLAIQLLSHTSVSRVEWNEATGQLLGVLELGIIQFLLIEPSASSRCMTDSITNGIFQSCSLSQIISASNRPNLEQRPPPKNCLRLSFLRHCSNRALLSQQKRHPK